MEVASGITQPPGLAITFLPDAPSSVMVRCGRARPDWVLPCDPGPLRPGGLLESSCTGLLKMTTEADR